MIKMSSRALAIFFALVACLSGLVSGCTAVRPSQDAFESAQLPYTLASGDKLRIIVFGQDNLSNIYAVDGTGQITMPLIGSLLVQGQTAGQVSKLIEARLKTDFIREPKVTVEIETYRPFFILGEVINSGQFAYVNGMNVQKAVAIAGGFSPRASQAYVEITRQTVSGVMVKTVPLSYPVRPGDTIKVVERWF